jgi:hypothetical protein
MMAVSADDIMKDYDIRDKSDSEKRKVEQRFKTETELCEN